MRASSTSTAATAARRRDSAPAMAVVYTPGGGGRHLRRHPPTTTAAGHPVRTTYDNDSPAGDVVAELRARRIDTSTTDAAPMTSLVPASGTTWTRSTRVDVVHGNCFNGSGPMDQRERQLVYSDARRTARNAWSPPAAEPDRRRHATASATDHADSRRQSAAEQAAAGVVRPGEHGLRESAASGAGTDRSVQSNNEAAWQNPGGGFGACCELGLLAARRAGSTRRTRSGVPSPRIGRRRATTTATTASATTSGPVACRSSVSSDDRPLRLRAGRRGHAT